MPSLYLANKKTGEVKKYASIDKSIISTNETPIEYFFKYEANDLKLGFGTAAEAQRYLVKHGVFAK